MIIFFLNFEENYALQNYTFLIQRFHISIIKYFVNSQAFESVPSQVHLKIQKSPESLRRYDEIAGTRHD